MATTRSRAHLGTANGRRTREVVDRVLREIDRQCRDVGMSHRTLAHRAKVDQGYVSRVLGGQRTPSIPTLVALSEALGSDLSIRLFPRAGARIFDESQARIVEALLRLAAPSSRGYPEVPVVRPVRGFVDLVLDRAAERVLVATEVQTRIDRLEEQLRWMQEKADALTSSDLWRELGGDRQISRLLVLRSTVATRALANRFGETLDRAYPARVADVYAALEDSNIAWPGPGILWADLRAEGVSIMRQPPRGVGLGR